MTKKIMLPLLLMLTAVSMAMAQGKKITGTVLNDADNEPIIGAHVQVVGTKLVAVTDIDGNFAIADVPADAKRVSVSYIGMLTQEVAIKYTKMIIRLQDDSKALDDVMVVAFGEAKKSTFTGSAAVISGEKLAGVQTSNITNALAGQVAGVQTIKSSGRPGDGASIYIRGIGSFSASNAPLYIVDGAPFAGDISAINPQDIASMTIMKDAAANALYGARGANGVVIITTKRGEKGDARISIDAKWGTNRRGTKNYEVMQNPNAYMETLYQAMYNNRYNQLVKNLDPAKAAVQANQYVNDNIFKNGGMGVGYQMYTIPEGQYLIGTNGRLNPNASMGYKKGDYYYTNDNWEDELLDSNNLRQEYNASITGGTEKNDYFLSFGYIEDTGIIPKSGFNRYTSRVKNDYKVKEWLKIGENISFTHYKYADPAEQSGSGNTGNVFYVANSIAPVYSLYVRDAQGNIMRDSQNNIIYEFGDATTSDIYRAYVPGANPGADLALNKSYALSNIFDGNVYVEAEILKGLKARISYNYFFDESRINQTVNKYYGQYSFMGGYASVAHQRMTNTNFQQLLTYKKVFADKHSMDLLLGHELYTMSISGLSGSKANLFSNDVAELGNAISNPSTSSSTDYYATEGVFFRGQYDYMEKYFGSVSYRRDGSSRFSKEHRWGDFWSIGGGWLINREKFMENASWIDILKLKASYGEQGNDAVGGYYPWVAQYAIVDINDQISLSRVNEAAPNLTWEASRNFNCGIDFSLFKYRLNGSIEFFNRQTDDMLYARPMAISNGIGSLLTNIGSVRNRGIELDVNGTVMDNWHGLTVNMNANITHLRNKILSLAPELGGSYQSGNYMRREGHSMYNLYIRRWAGIDPQTGAATWYKDVKDAQGNVTGMEKTTSWADATEYELGDVMPTFYGGFGLNASWRGIDFGITFSYQMGGKLYDSGYASLMHNGSSGAGMNWHKDMLNAWTPTNPNTDIPVLNTAASSSYDNAVSDRFLISSNYLSLNNVTVGYTFPKRWTSRAKLDNVRIYFVADNVALWSRRNGLDPRQSFITGSNTEYSILRSMSGGITVDF